MKPITRTIHSLLSACCVLALASGAYAKDECKKATEPTLHQDLPWKVIKFDCSSTAKHCHFDLGDTFTIKLVDSAKSEYEVSAESKHVKVPPTKASKKGNKQVIPVSFVHDSKPPAKPHWITFELVEKTDDDCKKHSKFSKKLAYQVCSTEPDSNGDCAKAGQHGGTGHGDQ